MCLSNSVCVFMNLKLSNSYTPKRRFSDTFSSTRVIQLPHTQEVTWNVYYWSDELVYNMGVDILCLIIDNPSIILKQCLICTHI